MTYYEVIDEQIAQGRIEPTTNQIYNTAQVYDLLALADSPYLLILWNGKERPVQTSHMTREQTQEWIKACASEARWRYVRTTHEWIPLFLFQEGVDPVTFLDAETLIDDFSEGGLWITPKGFPREQYDASKRPRAEKLEHWHA